MPVRPGPTPISRTAWGRIEGLVKIEIQRLVAPAGAPKGGSSRRSERRFRRGGCSVRRVVQTNACSSPSSSRSMPTAEEVREIVPVERGRKLAAIEPLAAELPCAYI